MATCWRSSRKAARHPPGHQDVRLQRIVTLDSMRVLAQRSRYPKFEQRRKMNGFGTFLTSEQIERRASFVTGDLFRVMPGFRVSGYGLDAKVYSIGAIEVYRAGQPAPVQYDRHCGVIVIWSK